MVKNSVIISVSIDKTEAEFLDSHKLSPSELLQSKIQEQIRLFREFNTENEALKDRIATTVDEMKRYNQFLENIGQFDNYFKWRKDVV